MPRKIVHILLYGTILSVFLYGVISLHFFVTALEKNRQHPIVQKKADETLLLGFVGDIVPAQKDMSHFFESIAEYTKKPDLMIGNFEGTVTEESISKCDKIENNCFAFKGNTSILESLQKAGFDVLNIANNHSYDYGEKGNAETINNIQDYGMIASGQKDQVATTSIHGTKIAVIGFSSYEWTNQFFDQKEVTKIVQNAKKDTDIVIVVFHGGKEGRGAEIVPTEKEWYLGEDRGDLMLFAKTAIDAGADIVLGSGPHILRGFEIYKNKLIAYSLGNFASGDPRALTNGILGDTGILFVEIDKNKLYKATFVPAKIENGDPKLLDKKTADDILYKINQLSQTNFPNSAFIFEK